MQFCYSNRIQIRTNQRKRLTGDSGRVPDSELPGYPTDIKVWQHAWSIANQGSSPNFQRFYWDIIDGMITIWLNSISSPPLHVRLISVIQSPNPLIIWLVFLMCLVPIPSYLLSISYLGTQHESLHCHKLPGMVPLGAHLNYKDTAITGEPLTEVNSQELGRSPAFPLRPNFLLYICQLSVLFIQKMFRPEYEAGARDTVMN